jgi:hypothetical protein
MMLLPISACIVASCAWFSARHSQERIFPGERRQGQALALERGARTGRCTQKN